jgi:hypothetical protein
MKSACHHARAVLAEAIQAVDDVVGDNDCAIDGHQQLVTAYMSAAGAAYVALSVQNAVEMFCEYQEEKTKREKYALCVPTLKQ